MAESPVKEMDVRTNKGNLCCYYLQYSMGLHGHTLKRVQFIFLCALNHLLEDIGTFCVENSEKQEEFSGGWCRGRQINEVCIRLFGTVTFLSYAIIILCLFYFSIRRVGAGSSSSSTLSPVVIMFDDEGFVLCELSCGWWEHDKWFPNGNLDKKGISAQLLKRVCNMRSSSVFNGFSFS